MQMEFTDFQENFSQASVNIFSLPIFFSQQVELRAQEEGIPNFP